MRSQFVWTLLTAGLMFGIAHSGECPCKSGPCKTTAVPQDGRPLCVRFRERMSRHSNCRGTTHHDIGCTGCRADKIFIFGSCWEFFEEPCLRGMPSSAHGNCRSCKKH